MCACFVKERYDFIFVIWFPLIELHCFRHVFFYLPNHVVSNATFYNYLVHLFIVANLHVLVVL